MSVRTVRNFWLEGSIDGYKTDIKGGPKSSTGGFKLRIYMRNQKKIENPVTIIGKADENGNLKLLIEAEDNDSIIIEKER